MKIVAVIPARYKSTRFPGKPLVDICGKPMIWWVYQEAKKITLFEDVVVATDSDSIKEVCDKYFIKYVMTSENCPSGTDRVAEVSKIIDADAYCAVMGDEPLLASTDEETIVKEFISNPSCDAIMLVKKFTNPVDVVNDSTIKLAINKNHELIYMSRAPIPHPKAMLNYSYYKHIGCYILKKETLDFMMKTEHGLMENVEDLEMLRLIENHKIIRTVEVDSDSMSVDTYKDLERIRSIMKDRISVPGLK